MIADPDCGVGRIPQNSTVIPAAVLYCGRFRSRHWTPADQPRGAEVVPEIPIPPLVSPLSPSVCPVCNETVAPLASDCPSIPTIGRKLAGATFLNGRPLAIVYGSPKGQ